MNHKRRRAKNRRAGCLLCKPHKGNGMKGRHTSQTLQSKKSGATAHSQLLDLEYSGALRRPRGGRTVDL